MSISRGARQILKDLQTAGLTHVLHCEPQLPATLSPHSGAAPTHEGASVRVESHQSDLNLPERGLSDSVGKPSFREAFEQAQGQKKASAPLTPTTAALHQQHVVAKSSVVPPNQVENLATIDERRRSLQILAETVSKCTRCTLLATMRTQTVFGVGNPNAKIMFIGEAPGADEDRTGEPFVGKAGQLLDKIVEACGWKREDLYICNILRCRPPENRTPTEQEACNCREFLDQQIATVDPEYIVCWGTCAAQNLLGTKETIGKMRQKVYEFGRAKVICTYHPSYLLRNAAAKKPVWDDMKMLMAEMQKHPA